ncbi:MAG: chorismate synthase [Candidatus Melainabacteria bacterium]|nr:MAG: chorismate synthase [Candidatus Melainabacteria bacterium]
MRFFTSGESHGPTLTAIVDGMPAGLMIDIDAINAELAARQQGYGRGNRQKIETDTVSFVGGVRHGVTTGAPITLMVANRDFANWKYVMSVEPTDMTTPEAKEQADKKAIERFRPGHADLAGTLKFDQSDIRDVLERASARETAARVAVGALCQQLLGAIGARSVNHVVQVASVKCAALPVDISLDEIEKLASESELSATDKSVEDAMKDAIKAAWQEGDSLGGVVEVLVDGLPVGLGSYTQWDRKIDGRIAQAVMSIQAFKAVEIGDGVLSASLPGSQVHDPLYPSDKNGRNSNLPFSRKTNHAGGIEGGMTNGSRLVVKGYMKPLPTMRKGLDSLSFPEFEPARAHYERSDVCAIAAASVVMKAMVNYVLADALLEKFACDSIRALKESFESYTLRVQNFASKGDQADSEKKAATLNVEEGPELIGEF